jgi:hypothetical protein
LSGAYKVLEKFENDLLVLALGELFHGWSHQVELLLEIVEADLSYIKKP